MVFILLAWGLFGIGFLSCLLPVFRWLVLARVLCHLAAFGCQVVLLLLGFTQLSFGFLRRVGLLVLGHIAAAVAVFHSLTFTIILQSLFAVACKKLPSCVFKLRLRILAPLGSLRRTHVDSSVTHLHRTHGFAFALRQAARLGHCEHLVAQNHALLQLLLHCCNLRMRFR